MRWEMVQSALILLSQSFLLHLIYMNVVESCEQSKSKINKVPLSYFKLKDS